MEIPGSPTPRRTGLPWSSLRVNMGELSAPSLCPLWAPSPVRATQMSPPASSGTSLLQLAPLAPSVIQSLALYYLPPPHPSAFMMVKHLPC